MLRNHVSLRTYLVQEGESRGGFAEPLEVPGIQAALQHLLLVPQPGLHVLAQLRGIRKVPVQPGLLDVLPQLEGLRLSRQCIHSYIYKHKRKSGGNGWYEYNVTFTAVDNDT